MRGHGTNTLSVVVVMNDVDCAVVDPVTMALFVIVVAWPDVGGHNQSEKGEQQVHLDATAVGWYADVGGDGGVDEVAVAVVVVVDGCSAVVWFGVAG